MFDLHRTSRIVQVDITECNDVTYRHGIVITIWWTSAIKVAALLENQRFEIKGMKEKESIMDVRNRL